MIGLDVDGVLANLMDPWLRRYNRDYVDTLKKTDITDFDIHKFVKPECGPNIYNYLHQSSLYDEVRPIPGSQTVVKALKNADQKIVFVTTNVEGMTDAKAKWLYRYGFTDKPFKDMIHVRDKSLIRVDVLVDDRPATVRNLLAKGLPVILFSQPWNQKVEIEKDFFISQWGISSIEKIANACRPCR